MDDAILIVFYYLFISIGTTQFLFMDLRWRKRASWRIKGDGHLAALCSKYSSSFILTNLLAMKL